MKHISILVPKGAAALSCIEGPYTLFNKVNEFLENMGKRPMFKVQLVGATREAQVYDRMFTVCPDVVIAEVSHTDLIIIPAVNGDMRSVIEWNHVFNSWINTQYAGGAEVASLCVGAFLLAATGLMNGKKCATHWGAVNDFKSMFPEVNLVSEKIITDEQGIYSSGGANSFWNLLLYLVEKFTDRQMSILCAKYYEIEMGRSSQSPFIMFKGQKEHQDESVKKAQDFIEKNFQDKITVEKLSVMFSVGRRSLERRFKKATCNTVSAYIQRVKMEAAKKGFETSRKNITEVMYDVGYSDTKAFRTVFKRNTGLSPVEYRNRYNKEVMMFHQN
ncbi:MAG: helix-turn-helix-domain containing protein AraC type [Ferruginibacter sp.]|nr:helix-turn-helix-domain containing protein AraC type [Ferruginibacter sp.]